MVKPSKKAGEKLKFATNGSPLVQERNFSESALPATTPPFKLQEVPHKPKTMSTETTSPTDNVEIYRQLEEYPWDTDKEFQVC